MGRRVETEQLPSLVERLQNQVKNNNWRPQDLLSDRGSPALKELTRRLNGGKEPDEAQLVNMRFAVEQLAKEGWQPDPKAEASFPKKNVRVFSFNPTKAGPGRGNTGAFNPRVVERSADKVWAKGIGPKANLVTWGKISPDNPEVALAIRAELEASIERDVALRYPKMTKPQQQNVINAAKRKLDAEFEGRGIRPVVRQPTAEAALPAVKDASPSDFEADPEPKKGKHWWQFNAEEKRRRDRRKGRDLAGISPAENEELEKYERLQAKKRAERVEYEADLRKRTREKGATWGQTFSRNPGFLGTMLSSIRTLDAQARRLAIVGLLVGLAFIPVGFFTFAGWSIVAVAMVIISAAYFVFLNAVKVVASLVVTFINTVFSVIGGAIVSVTERLLILLPGDNKGDCGYEFCSGREIMSDGLIRADALKAINISLLDPEKLKPEMNTKPLIQYLGEWTGLFRIDLGSFFARVFNEKFTSFVADGSLTKVVLLWFVPTAVILGVAYLKIMRPALRDAGVVS